MIEQWERLFELRRASKRYESLLIKRLCLHSRWNYLWNERPPGWKENLRVVSKRMGEVRGEILYLEKKYGDALFITKSAPLWEKGD